MLISHHYRFIFIHNYKVAGTSVREALAPFRQSKWERLQRKIGWQTKKYNDGSQNHLKALEVKKLLGEATFDAYYTFGFVRNPWDWQVSLYHYALKNKDHKQHQLISNMSGFEEYLHWRIANDINLQKGFFYDSSGICLVNFIGRFETLATDFEYICQQINIKASLPHRNKSQDEQAYLKQYTRETIDLVAQHYQEDCEIFGYETPRL